MAGDRQPMFWTVSTTEMSREQAVSIAEKVEAECPGVYADAVDPTVFFTLSFDRWTTELLKDALLALRDRGGEPAGLLEDVVDWLENQAEPYAPDSGSEDRYQPVVAD